MARQRLCRPHNNWHAARRPIDKWHRCSFRARRGRATTGHTLPLSAVAAFHNGRGQFSEEIDFKMSQQSQDRRQHQPASEPPTSTSVTITVHEGGGGQVRGGGHRARQQFSNNLFHRHREQQQHRRIGRRGDSIRQSSAPSLSASSSSSNSGNPTAVAARLAVLSVGDRSQSDGSGVSSEITSRAASPGKGCNYCARRSSEPTLSITSAVPSSLTSCHEFGSTKAMNASPSTNTSNYLLNNSIASDCTHNSNSTSNSRQSNASSIGSLWEERNECRRRQVGPNPFAFF